MPRTNLSFPVSIEMINAQFADLARWRLKHSGIAQKKEHLMQNQRRQLQG